MKSWLSPAKLNLFLYITGRRPDHYHDLQTLFQFIDYCDTLNFTLRQDNQLNLLTPFQNVPNDKNLIIIAAKLLQTYASQFDLTANSLGVDIKIDKKIPMGGGLGGASSNAATVLVALNQLWHLNLPTETLIDLGRTIGADVPIFIYGQAAFAEGIGDKLQAVSLPEYYYLVTCPNIAISTVKVFNDPELTRNTPRRSLDDLLALPYVDFSNDCEKVVRKRYPIIDSLIEQLSAYGPTRLTGTGSSVFTQCNNRQEALAIQSALQTSPIYHSIAKTFIAKGVNRSPLFA
ncbi:4-(cytidine 5'-diphospho)-2-C-methyl-D-erythritol kinase [Orbaceae bacterium ESL0727]|nr:4-(cytidine 5'-diphospho)-2-C-methyl-D-erythritol kinase [Orbaceae bacterium ESL0727]